MCGSGSHTEPSCERRGWRQSKTRRAMCMWATASPQFSNAPFRQLQTIAANEAATEQSSTASHSARARSTREVLFSIKVSQLAELREAVVDLLPGELRNALGAKALYSKRAHHAAVEHCAAKGARSEGFL